jgi:hypothetical protein
MERDILTQLVDHYWNWIAEFHPALQMLILRWGLILILLLAFGISIRCLRLRWGVQSLAAQIGAVVFALIISLSIPIEPLIAASNCICNTCITISLVAWIFFPYFLPHLLIRRMGFQAIMRLALYGIEILLVTIQLILNT